MKLWRKFKYFLLQWLLDDICGRYVMCSECPCDQEKCLDCYDCPVTLLETCAMAAVTHAAEKAWELEEKS